jgi:tocopherol cyclase
MPLFRPELFQGARKRKSYFEGWYFKQVSADTSEAWAFIPGVSMNADGSSRTAFIQAIDGARGLTRWYPFAFEDFSWQPGRLELAIGPNRFSTQGISVDLDGPDGKLSADLRYGTFSPFPSRPWMPGIMGPYSFVPFMECRHGLVSMDHTVDGWVQVDGRRFSMDNGRGYIEKDWGSSMPSSWIWTQSNQFPTPGDSLMFSLANIPWMGSHFPGFLCAARLSEGGKQRQVQVWATWNGSRIDALRADDSTVSLVIAGKDERLSLELGRRRGGLLLAPVAGAMERRIAESIDSTMSVRLERKGKLVYEALAPKAGLETVGNLAELGLYTGMAKEEKRK